MICWSCEKAAGDGVTCSSCGAIQPPDTTADHFAVLGLPRRYAVDATAAESAFKDLSRRIHPDRFAKADPRARRAALARSVQLNEAWRTIKDPIRRAEYLLGLAGYEVGAEEGASRPAPGGPGAPADDGRASAGAGRERIPVPPALLMEILELREELADARADGNHARVDDLARAMRARQEEALARVAAAFVRAEALDPVTATAATATDRDAILHDIARELIAIRYFRRFLEEAARDDDDRDASGAAPPLD